MSKSVNAETMSKKFLEEIYRAAIGCNVCFVEGRLKRSFIDVAQPRYVGTRYWSSARRLVFLSTNPGAGSGDTFDQEMRSELYAFKMGTLSLEELLKFQRSHLASWANGKFAKYFERIGIDIEEVALLNVAQCATMDNKYPPFLRTNCMERHTMKLIQVLQPNCLVACGKVAQHAVDKLDLKVVKAPHYAARGFIDYDQIRRDLKAYHSGLAIKSAETADVLSPLLNRSTHTKIIRLLQPANPKIGKSALRYACYRDGMSVADYKIAVSSKLGDVEAKKCNIDIKWDVAHHFIRLEPST